MERVRVAVAAKRLGVHPDTVRRWADEGRLACDRVSGQRRFLLSDLDAFIDGREGARLTSRRAALYVRVSASEGQASSLANQEAELREVAAGEIVGVYKDRGSGLSEKRKGLQRLLIHAQQGKFDVVYVTHEDRLARFGTGWLTELLARDGVTVEVVHEKGSAGGMEELLADFMSLVASFSGRMYGIRSRDNKRRLLERAREHTDGEHDG